MKQYEQTLAQYKNLNKTAKKNVSVFFGADWLSAVPLAELARDSETDSTVYNRSLKGLMLSDAEKVFETCICELCPSKVFINIGENDIISSDFDADKFISVYEWLMYSIHSRCNCNLYILSIINDKSGTVNALLKKLSEKHGCTYIDIQKYRESFPAFFSKIKFFLRDRLITFYEAMNA